MKRKQLKTLKDEERSKMTWQERQKGKEQNNTCKNWKGNKNTSAQKASGFQASPNW